MRTIRGGLDVAADLGEGGELPTVVRAAHQPVAVLSGTVDRTQDAFHDDVLAELPNLGHPSRMNDAGLAGTGPKAQSGKDSGPAPTQALRLTSVAGRAARIVAASSTQEHGHT